MSDANRIVNSILNVISARDEDARREAGEALESVIHEIACSHAMRVKVAQHTPQVAQGLPPGWIRESDDLLGPRFWGPNRSRVEVDNNNRVFITANDMACGIPIAVLRAFIAALDAGNGTP